MIKFQFKIIVEKNGIEKTVKPLKGILQKPISILGMILAIFVVSSLIGLGIHLSLAAVEGINIGTDLLSDNWEIYKTGNAYVRSLFTKGDLGQIQALVIKADEYLESDGDFKVNGRISVSNQGRGAYKSAFRSQDSSAATISCPDGSYLYAVRINKDGRYSYGFCRAPLEPVTPIVERGTRVDEEELRRGKGDWLLLK